MPGSGALVRIDVQGGDLSVLGTIGSNLVSSVDMSGGDLLELITLSPAGRVVLDSLLRSGTRGVDVYSASDIVWNPLLRSKLESLITVRGPRN